MMWDFLVERAGDERRAGLSGEKKQGRSPGPRL